MGSLCSVSGWVIVNPCCRRSNQHAQIIPIDYYHLVLPEFGHRARNFVFLTSKQMKTQKARAAVLVVGQISGTGVIGRDVFLGRRDAIIFGPTSKEAQRRRWGNGRIFGAKIDCAAGASVASACKASEGYLKCAAFSHVFVEQA